uniref:Tail tape measure protein n=1 Tax=Rhizobium phage LG08 TaxID=3129229 RepID=A0AAU8HY55_9CAUD
MAALPKIANFEKEVAGVVQETVDKAVRKLTDQFDSVAKSMMGKSEQVLDQLKEPFMTLYDAAKINSVGKAFAAAQRKIGDALHKATNTPRRKDQLEILTEKTEQGFSETVDALEKIEQFFKDTEKENRQQEKEEKEKFQEPTSDPVEEVNPKKSADEIFKAMFLGLKTRILAAIPIALKGIALVSIIGTAIEGLVYSITDYTKGALNASESGDNQIAGGIKALLVGVENDIMSKFHALGRWTAAGAALGLPLGIPGIIAGGTVGAALGAAALAVDYLFGDYIQSALDTMVDGTYQLAESVFGTDKDRLQGRIDDMKKKSSSINEAIEKSILAISELRVQLTQAELSGNSATADILRRKINTNEKIIADGKVQLEKIQQKEESFKKEMALADASFFEKFGNWAGEVSSSMDRALLALVPNSVVQWFAEKERALSDWTSAAALRVEAAFMGTVDSIVGAYDENIAKPIEKWWSNVEKLSGLAYGIVETKITETWDSFMNMLTEEIPDTITSIITGMKNKLKEYFDYAKNLGSVMYEEISFSDFNPFAEGPSYAERIGQRMSSIETSSRIRENAASQNANAEAAFSAINDSLAAALDKASNTNVNSVKTTKVENNAYYDSGLSVRDRDPVSARDYMGVNGMMVLP